MKIHIVKKGDTLWKIAELYDVDFEELKQMNAHLSHPDMIMPGMKIRVPVHKKETKKEQPPAKEKKKETKKSEQKPKEQMKKPQPTKPMEEIKEDDHKDHIQIQPVIPFEQQKSPSLNMNTMPKMPSMPKMPQMSPVEEPKEENKKEKPKEKPIKVKEKEEVPPKEMESEKTPLTSHGCYCYCGTCSPMHFEGTQMMPSHQQHMPMHMMYPSHSCGCQQPMMHGNHMMHGHFMQQPMMNGHLMQGNMHQQMMVPTHMHPTMMEPNHMQHPMMDPQYMRPAMMDPTHQPMPLPHSENHGNMQAHQNEPMQPEPQAFTPEGWQREDAEEVEKNDEQTDENPVRQSYPPMYSEQSEYYSYPQPPEFIHEE